MTESKMVSLRSVALALWELPQDALGLLLLGAARALGDVVGLERDMGRLFIESRSLGVSLGYFVFWSQGRNRYFRADSLMKRHEYGHSFQSRWLGPLYLPLVGVPSVSRVFYGMVYREVKGT
ncbi:MAG: hypothetical protein JRI68_19140, partial [Deltaproteobacteria bacterium]|nr:hypothetical protein [Deltaproteobacteria bacterium]